MVSKKLVTYSEICSSLNLKQQLFIMLDKKKKKRNYIEKQICSFPSYNFSKIHVGCVRGAPSSNNDEAWVVVKISDYIYPS